MRQAIFLFILCQIFIIGPAHAETLGEVLSRQGMSGYLNDVAANQQITSHSIYEDRNVFLLAYYRVLKSDPLSLDSTLYLLFIDRLSSELIHREIFLPDVLSNSHLSAIGSVVNIQKIEAHYFLKGHINPSVSPTLVLSQDLKVHDVLPGWVVSVAEGGRVVIQTNMIHFSQPQTPQFTLYDLQSRTHKLIATPRSSANRDDT